MNVNFWRLKILFFSLLNVISFVSAGHFLGQVWTINCFLDSSSCPHSDRLYLSVRDVSTQFWDPSSVSFFWGFPYSLQCLCFPSFVFLIPKDRKTGFFHLCPCCSVTMWCTQSQVKNLGDGNSLAKLFVSFPPRECVPLFPHQSLSAFVHSPVLPGSGYLFCVQVLQLFFAKGWRGPLVGS